MNPTLAALYIHPLKSCAPFELAAAAVEPRGLRFDRRWMLIDAEGRFLTGREQPRLTLIRAEAHHDGLRLNAPGMPPLWVPTGASEPRFTVTVWKSTLDAVLLAAADAWLERLLGEPARLVWMDAHARRPTATFPDDEVSFADAYPLLAISQAALDTLNARLATPVTITRFRPNLVLDGCAPHAEDGWRRIRIGGVEFEAAKPCIRCVFTTVDPEQGERDPAGEPLRTLIGYRRGANGVSFGQLFLPRGSGVLQRGDAVQVLD
jgi:uncharacterized protein